MKCFLVTVIPDTLIIILGDSRRMICLIPKAPGSLNSASSSSNLGFCYLRHSFPVMPRGSPKQHTVIPSWFECQPSHTPTNNWCFRLPLNSNRVSRCYGPSAVSLFGLESTIPSTLLCLHRCPKPSLVQSSSVLPWVFLEDPLMRLPLNCTSLNSTSQGHGWSPCHQVQ